MNGAHTAAFDSIAFEYDALWTNTPVGESQRQAVWNWIDPLFKPGSVVLDLGCGTGADAIHLLAAGVQVYGVDSSPNMVTVARAKGVDAHCIAIQDLRQSRARFDGAVSNFGALNCVDSLPVVAEVLAQLVRSRRPYRGLLSRADLLVGDRLFPFARQAWQSVSTSRRRHTRLIGP